ncbi:VOC family protein [Mycobacterium shimoidei]|uniref:Biphenyl-2,3-diol 1,2-dioxygenase [Segniliparus rotundus DSM] n=1 Tax=Mycobacterium shimoidei TaxID=29313 RepID=A0A375YSX7_MYCSH|nr:VOC family protein [Mycobacterium shimoidei]SRX91922.1 biphenyl-2,3-diol 1,2-dioxygenase [Segniliparus rotundus DSM] [Mycobacterium shimoidei]
MSSQSMPRQPVQHDGMRVPDYLAHWVVKTARSKQMIAWYQTVFGARIVHEDRKIAFLTWDAESHRLALIKLPGVLRYLFPFSRWRRKFYGIDHLGLGFKSLDHLLSTYERLKEVGITPVWSINHGPTTSLYYEDPDGSRLEFQTENFPTGQATADYFRGSAFAANPIGVTFDPDYLLERLRAGADPAELLQQGAGTRPGTTARANKRALTWKTL